jgi:hypothetical protein
MDLVACRACIRRLPVLLGCAILLLLGTVVACSGPRHLQVRLLDGIDVGYLDHGRHRARPEVRRLLEQLPGMRRRSVQQIHRKTGIPIPEEPMVIVPLDDQRFCFSEWRVIEGRRRRVVVLDMDDIIEGDIDLDQVLTHELTHTMMHLGARKPGQRFPKWFTEGLAVWVAGQIRLKAERDILVALVFERSLGWLSDGIKHRNHHSKDYLQDGLTFAWLHDQRGLTGVKRVVAASLAGTHPAKAIEEETARPWRIIRRELSAYTQAYLDKLAEDSGYSELQRDQPRYRMCLDGNSAECASALETLQRFVDTQTDSFLVEGVLYRIAQIHKQTGQLPKSIAALRRSLQRKPFLRLKLLLGLGELYVQDKQWEQARISLEPLLNKSKRLPQKTRKQLNDLLCRSYEALGLHELKASVCEDDQGNL